MYCLKGYIGLSARVAAVESNLYVDTLPGISLNNLSKIADKTDQFGNEGEPDAKKVFDECEDNAIQTFISAFIAGINECYCISDTDVINCIICANKTKLGVALRYYIAHELMIERTVSDRLNKYTTIDLKKAKELRDMFIDRAQYELQIAVKGINPHDGDCTEVPIEHREMIKTVLPII
jgi:hypothetical protein